MFGRISNNRGGETQWFDYNAKTGLFTRTHQQQNAEGSYRVHVNTKGRTVFKEEYPDLLSAVVRRVMVKEEPSYDDRNVMEKKIQVSLRSPDGKDAVIKFSMGSSALQILGALNAADLTKPITLKNYLFPAGEKISKDGVDSVREKDEVRLVGYQGDTKLKNVYGPEGTEIPKAKNIEVKNDAGKVISNVKDFSAQQEFIVNLANAVAEKVKSAQAHQPAPSAAPESHAPAPAAASDEPHDDEPLSAVDIVGDGGEDDALVFAQQQ